MAIKSQALDRIQARARKHMQQVFPELHHPSNYAVVGGTIAAYGRAVAYTNAQANGKLTITFTTGHRFCVVAWQDNKLIVEDEFAAEGVGRHEWAHQLQTQYERKGYKGNYSTHKADSWLIVMATWAERVHGEGTFLSYEELRELRALSHKQYTKFDSENMVKVVKFPEWKKRFSSLTTHFLFNHSKEELIEIASVFRAFLNEEGPERDENTGKKIRNLNLETECKYCGKFYIAKTTRSKYCSNAHRMQSYLDRKVGA